MSAAAVARTAPQHAAGFTLLELLLAMGVGLFVLNVALYAFFFNQKIIHKIEVVGAKNDVAQHAVMWALNKQYLGLSHPAGVQFRQIGAAAMTYKGGDRYLLLQIEDWSKAQGPNPPYQVATLPIPVTGN